MDVIRSNYSTLGPIAQKEAPAAPEYPYTDMLAAYRGALESFDHYFQEEEENAAADSKKDDSPIWANHTRAFNRILSHFFGDYFTEDADEELASDMAERWASFAKVSDPNYDGSKAEWLPWRYSVDVDMFQDWEDDVDDNVDPDNPWVTEGEYDYWSDIDDYSDDPDSEWTPEKEERMYRRRALASLGMEVVDEDVFRTELRRTALLSNDAVVDKKFLSSRFLFRTSLKWNTHDEGDKPTMSPRAMREAVLFAKEIGALGMGLAGDDRFPELGGESDFFPELFELRWPPEGRLIERDCTCDMWDKIRCKWRYFSLLLRCAKYICFLKHLHCFFSPFFIVIRSLLKKFQTNAIKAKDFTLSYFLRCFCCFKVLALCIRVGQTSQFQVARN
jgi:hypothetical protein